MEPPHDVDVKNANRRPTVPARRRTTSKACISGAYLGDLEAKARVKSIRMRLVVKVLFRVRAVS